MTSIATLFGTAPSVIVKVVPETVKAVIAVPSSLTVNAAALSAAVPSVKTLVDPSPVKVLTTLEAVLLEVCGSTSVVILSTSACVTWYFRYVLDGDNNLSSEISIYNKKLNDETSDIVQDISLNTKNIKITGLYDPEDYDLNINMWSNSDGDQLKDLFGRIAKLNLSDDASELMNISILTNAHYPKKILLRKSF